MEKKNNYVSHTLILSLEYITLILDIVTNQAMKSPGSSHHPQKLSEKKCVTVVIINTSH